MQNQNQRKEKFEQVWAPKLRDAGLTITTNTERLDGYNMYHPNSGHFVFFPKANKTLRRDKWHKEGLKYLIEKYLNGNFNNNYKYIVTCDQNREHKPLFLITVFANCKEECKEKAEAYLNTLEVKYSIIGIELLTKDFQTNHTIN